MIIYNNKGNPRIIYANDVSLNVEMDDGIYIYIYVNNNDITNLNVVNDENALTKIKKKKLFFLILYNDISI